MEDGFPTVSIIGVGLVGGSLALALKEKGLAKKITGYGRNHQRLKEALKLGIIDDYTTSLEESAKADLIVLATPVGVFEELITRLVRYLKKGTVVIDVGSVKEPVVNTLEKIFPDGIHFVGTHPIAGSDKTGFEYARADLFKEAKVIITPTDHTDIKTVERIVRLWQSTGAVVEFMDAAEHDKIYALMSHLPHLISFCLVNTVAEIDTDFIKYAGSGFKSSTRIAKSSPELWKDIFMMNRENILHCLDVFIRKLDEVKTLMSSEPTEELKKFMEKAKKLRESID